MRTWLLVGLLLIGTGLATGCATVTKSPQENRAAMRAITELDLLQMGDDWNLLWLTDRQSRLTKWHTR
ncbi:MAG: hypothetical protein AB1601_12670 [Planctomycetota bacterium]|jgi:hypothetical protein